jgi:hypothetical protein
MANPFDQFDVATKAGNPFDQFDTPAKRERTTLEAVKDVGAGLVSGAGALTQLPGQLYGLATGDFSDTGLTKIGRELRETGEGMKSEELKRREAERSAKIKEAGKEGEFAAGLAAFKETVADPALLTNFIAEQAPNLIPGFAVARGLRLAGAGAKAATAGAIGTGATQQGADIGAETFKEMHKKLVDQGMSPEEATGRVLGFARAAGLEAGVISLGAQMLPGGRAIERAMAKTPIKGNRIISGIKGGAGEAVSEMIEEGGGKVAQNLAVQNVDPTRSLTEGLGETMGMAAVGGLGLGTAAGVASRREAPEAKPEPTAEPAAGAEPPAEPAAPTEPAPPVEPAPPAEPGVQEPRPPVTLAPPSDEAVAAMGNYWEGKPEDFGMSFADIQNRDRSRPASIQQMTSIAAAPDYNRLSVSRDFGAGAPVVITDFEIPNELLGRIDTVSASDGTKIPVQYAVLDAIAIMPSNRYDGTPSEYYANPETPGTRPVAGNGRVAGLQKAYIDGTAADYMQSMINDPSHGINSDIISQIKEPVLVRIMPKSSLTPDIADKSNVGGQLGMSPTEQAKIDMGRFDLQGIGFLADGSPSLNSVRQFVAAMPKEEQANLINKQGQPTPLARMRLANALFAKAYANDALIDLYAETTDAEAKQILNGMSIAAPAMSNLEGAGDYDIRQYVAKAAELAVNARRAGTDLATYVDQGDIEMDPLTREVVSMFAANKNAPRRIGDSLSSLAAEAQKAAEQATAEPDMFGETAVQRPLEDVFAVLRGEPTVTVPVAQEQLEKQEYQIDKSVEEIDKEIDGMTPVQLADWLVDNAPNSFAKVVSEAIRSRVKAMRDRKIPMSLKIRRGAERKKYEYGVVFGWTQPARYEVELNGPNKPGQAPKPAGTDYSTILHEMLHLATQGQITIAEKTKMQIMPGPIKDLENLRKFIRKKVNEDRAAGRPVPSKLNNDQTLKNVHELIAYSMSEIDVQKYLADINYKNKNAFTRFVDAIRRLLAINKTQQSALERLVSLTEETLEVPIEDIAAGFTASGAGREFGVSTPQVAGAAEAPVTTESREPFEDAPVDPSEDPKRIQDKLEEKWNKMRTGAPKGKPSSFEGVDDDLWNKISGTFFPQNKNIVQKIDGMRDRFWQRLAQGVADQYRTIKDYSEEAYMKARMAKTIDGALEGILFNGEVKLTDGALDIAKDTKGLLKALEPVGNEVDRYQIWVALKRDAELVRAGKAPSVPKEIVKRLDELSNGKINGKSRLQVYEQVQKDMNRLNRSVLRIAYKQGLIDKEAYKVYARDINYIPFYKVMDEGGDVQAAATKSGLVNQYFSKALKGGEKPFGDLMENTLRNWSHILSASMKNEAANATVKAAMDMGGAFPNLKAGLRWEDGKVYSDKTDQMVGDGSLKPEYTSSDGKGLIKTMIDGKPAYFEVIDPLLLESIMSIGYMGPKSKFIDIARNFKNMLQFGVTVSPAFKIRNLFRDSISAIGVSDLKRNPFANVIQGWAASDRNNPAHISALAGGAIFNFGSMYEGDQAKLIKRLIEQGVKPDTILTTEDKIKRALPSMWRAYQDLGNKSESANRMALYQQMRDKGMSHLEASFYARDLLDFSMQGAWPALRLLTQTIPFLNARVQGLYKLGRDGIVPTSRVIYNASTGKPIEATDKQKAEQFGVVMVSVGLASLMLYMAFKDDEEFQKREQWDRDNFWWFKLPGMENALRIPKPFEIGAFGTMVERVAEQIFDKGVEGKVFRESLSRMLVDTFAINPIPQVFKPLVDLYSNKDSFTGAPIETAGMERLSKEQRIAEKTSPLAIALSKATNVFLPEATEVSPVQTDYAIKGYLGWMGGTASWLSHYAVQPFSKSAYPDNNWTETLSMGFIKSLPATQSKYVTAFYENNKQIAQAYADMRHFAQLGESDKVQEILKEKGDKIAMAKFYDNASKDMSEIRKSIIAIRNDQNMPGDQKKEEIDRLKIIIGEIARQMESARLDVKKQFAASQ